MLLKFVLMLAIWDFGIKLDEKLIAKQEENSKRFQPKTQKHKSGLFLQTELLIARDTRDLILGK